MAGKRKKEAATQHRCNAKESQAFKPSLAARHASPYGGVLHPALEPGKHETASGKLLVAWASGEDEGSDVEEWGPDRVCISRAE